MTYKEFVAHRTGLKMTHQRSDVEQVIRAAMTTAKKRTTRKITTKAPKTKISTTKILTTKKTTTTPTMPTTTKLATTASITSTTKDWRQVEGCVQPIRDQGNCG